METVMGKPSCIPTAGVRFAAACAISMSTLAVPASAGPRAASKNVEPAVIPADGSSGAVVTIRTDAPASSVTLDLAGGVGTVPFVPIDSQTFSAVLTPAQLLYMYLPSDVNRSFVGFINVVGGTPAEESRSSLFVNVDDATFADVPVLPSAPDMRCAPHIVNLQVPAEDPAELWQALDDEEQSLLTRFYEVFGDDYDFVNLIFLHPNLVANRGHFGVKNVVLGIGLPVFDNTASYGSAGALQGITKFPLDTLFDLAEPAALHELGHQWINFLTPHPLLGEGSPHWPPSQVALGLMGFTIPGTPDSEGGTFTFDFVPQGGNFYTLVKAAPLGIYTNLDLYLMGLVGAASVPTYVVLDPPDQALIEDSTVTGTVVSIADVIAAVGPRVPAVAAAPKHFRMATIVVTRTGFLTNRQLAFFDHFAARGEAVAPLPYHSGAVKGTANPFAIATQGVGSLDTSITCPLPTIEPPFEEEPICLKCPPDPCTNCPGLLRGIDLLIYPEVRIPGILTSLHTELLNAGGAYLRGQMNVATVHLRAFMKEIEAQAGKALTLQSATAISALTVRAAAVLGIPLGRTIERAP
jgi:hypothetical protein